MSNPRDWTFMPLDGAYLCEDCSTVGNCSTQCPACASTALMSLANVLGDRDDQVKVDRLVDRMLARVGGEI